MRGPLLWLVLLLVTVRTYSPTDLDTDQARQVGYVMDLLHGGDWAIQYEVNGQIATKPPLYNWLAAGVCVTFGTTAPWAMKLPSLAAGLGVIVLLHRIARREFDETVAFWSVVACVSAHHFIKLLWYARTDMLMTFWVYLAIYLTMTMRGSWTKALLIGAVTGMNLLTKGPVGPALYALWLPLWAWHTGSLLRYKEFPKVAAGAALAALIGGTWLWTVWDAPQFQDSVLGRELGDKLIGAEAQRRPFYYYFRELLGRAAPWPIVAAVAAFTARGQRNWPAVRFAILWTTGFLIFFTAFPDKRADRLLPVYPPIFMLAGVGLARAVEAMDRRRYAWISLAAAALYLAAPAVVPLVAKGEPIPLFAWVLAGGVALAGALALRAGARGNARSTVLWLAAGLVAANGIYHQGLGNPHGLEQYRQIREFAREVQKRAPTGQVLVWKGYPLISYELGLHQRGVDLSAVMEGSYTWIVSNDAGVAEITRETGIDFEPVSTVELGGKWGTWSLYRSAA